MSFIKIPPKKINALTKKDVKLRGTTLIPSKKESALMHCIGCARRGYCHSHADAQKLPSKRPSCALAAKEALS